MLDTFSIQIEEEVEVELIFNCIFEIIDENHLLSINLLPRPIPFLMYRTHFILMIKDNIHVKIV